MIFPSRTFVDYQGNIPAEWLNAVDDFCSGVSVDFLLAKQPSLDIVTTGGPEPTSMVVTATTGEIKIAANYGGGDADLVLSAGNDVIVDTDLIVDDDVRVGGVLFADEIREREADQGVEIDGLLVKDGGLVMPSGTRIQGDFASANRVLVQNTGGSSTATRWGLIRRLPVLRFVVIPGLSITMSKALLSGSIRRCSLA